MSNELNQNIYRYIFQSIRDEDQKSGKLLERFMSGFQSVWEIIHDRIFEITDFWDISEVEDAYLQYVQAIVGWTGKYTKITDALDDDTLRRLISISIALWKKRGSEDTTVDTLFLTTKARNRIFNWFDYRWVLDETQLGEEHQGRDPWIINLPNGNEEYQSNLRIVDDGSLNRELVRNIIKLMRPCGERYTINYLNFLEMFSTDKDETQWSTLEGDLVVGSGTGSLTDTTKLEYSVANITGSSTWDDYVTYTRIKGTGKFGTTFYKNDGGTLTNIDFDDQGNVALGVWGDGNFIYLANYDGGLLSYSVDQFGTLTHIDSDTTPDNAMGVWGDGNFIYVAGYTSGLHVYQADVLGNLTHVDSDDQGNFAMRVWGDGNFIYLANYDGGIHTYSVDVLGNLTHIDSDTTATYAMDVWGDGTFIYVAGFTSGIHVYEVDTLGNLTHKSSDDQGGYANGVWGDGNFIYLANDILGLQVYSVNSTGVLNLLDTDTQGDVAINVWGDGNLIYLANFHGGLLTYTVNSTTGALTFVDKDTQGGYAQDVWGDGEYIYLANDFEGLYSYSSSIGYYVRLEPTTNTISLHKIYNNTISTALVSFDYTPIGLLYENVYYGLRIDIQDESSTNRIKIYIDADLVIDTTDNSASMGTVGFLHETSGTIVCDEVEVFDLPVDSELIDINTTI